MSPISYRGPMEADENPRHTHSQTQEANLGVGQPGIAVTAIIADKGDAIYTVSPHTTVREVVAELNRLRVGALVVANANDEPIGIVSERDIVRNIDTSDLGIFEGPVEDIMTPNPQTCSPNDRVEAIMKRMTESRFRHMPVTKDGKLCGLVSIRDVVRHRLLEIEYENLKIKQAIVG